MASDSQQSGQLLEVVDDEVGLLGEVGRGPAYQQDADGERGWRLDLDAPPA